MKPETRAWLEKASLALNAARRNLTAEDADNAISRAYYAAFYAATGALNEANLATKSHKGIHKLFYREYIDSAKIDSHHNQAFSRLFQNRQVADYTDSEWQCLDKKQAVIPSEVEGSRRSGMPRRRDPSTRYARSG